MRAATPAPSCTTCGATDPKENKFCSNGFHAEGPTYWPVQDDDAELAAAREDAAWLRNRVEPLTMQERRNFAYRMESLIARLSTDTALVEALKEARDALQSMMDEWFAYHDAHSLTQPVTGAAGNAFEDALAARDRADKALASRGGDK
jgi:hypothetical protein